MCLHKIIVDRSLVPVRVGDRPKYIHACVNSPSVIDGKGKLVVIGGCNVPPTLNYTILVLLNILVLPSITMIDTLLTSTIRYITRTY